MSEILHFDSLSQIHAVIGIEPPKHPLISVVSASDFNVPKELIGQKVSGNFYVVMSKDKNCAMQYGRNYYDFEEGVLSFVGPNQVFAITEETPETQGWLLFFHPDLIRKTNLGKTIDSYSFFGYDVFEALHLSQKEENILQDCIDKVNFELDQNIDAHSQQLLVSNIELLLNYCKRFYDRQFNTRSVASGGVVTQVEQLIKSYYQEQKQLESGAPTTSYLADKVHLSANYLSDLLKKETGRNTKEHINEYIVNKAKDKLLQSSDSISTIAYDLGFNYPHYFSRMFKTNTGMTPNEFREIELN